MRLGRRRLTRLQPRRARTWRRPHVSTMTTVFCATCCASVPVDGPLVDPMFRVLTRNSESACGMFARRLRGVGSRTRLRGSHPEGQRRSSARAQARGRRPGDARRGRSTSSGCARGRLRVSAMAATSGTRPWSAEGLEPRAGQIKTPHRAGRTRLADHLSKKRLVQRRQHGISTPCARPAAQFRTLRGLRRVVSRCVTVSKGGFIESLRAEWQTSQGARRESGTDKREGRHAGGRFLQVHA
jgi:hypothetical protein